MRLRRVFDPQSLVLKLVAEVAPVDVDAAMFSRVQDVRHANLSEVVFLLHGGSVSQNKIFVNLVTIDAILDSLKIGQAGLESGHGPDVRWADLQVLRQKITASVSLFEGQKMTTKSLADFVLVFPLEGRSYFRCFDLGPRNLWLGFPSAEGRGRI